MYVFIYIHKLFVLISHIYMYIHIYMNIMQMIIISITTRRTSTSLARHDAL